MLVALLLAERRVGEHLYETADRLVTHEALARCFRVQRDAATFVGVSARCFHYKCLNYGITKTQRLKRRREGACGIVPDCG